MLLFRCKMKKVMYAYLFLSNICSTVVVVLHLFLFLITKIKKMVIL